MACYMRVAVCFSGQIRTGAVVAPNILRYIGDLLPQCDIFVHTWDIETQGTGYANRLGAVSTDKEWHDARPVADKDRFAAFHKAYNPRVMVVEEYNLQNTKSTWGGRRFNPITCKWYVSMWQSIYEANKLKMDYAAKNGIYYDYTVRMRPDIVFDARKQLVDVLAQVKNENMFLFGDNYDIWPRHGMTRVEDIFWIGPTHLMDRISSYHECYTNTVSNIDDPHAPGYQDWQFHSAAWITKDLGFQFYPLLDNSMRIFSQIDIDRGVDPLDPTFGTHVP